MSISYFLDKLLSLFSLFVSSDFFLVFFSIIFSMMVILLTFKVAYSLCTI